jgi:outer membrane protein assembly factor BamB
VDDLAAAHEAGGDELAGHQRAEAVLCDGDGITVLCTATERGGRERTVLLRLGDDGDLIRSDELPGAGRALAALPDGTLLIAGELQRGTLDFSALLLRVVPGGDVREFTFGDSGSAAFAAVTMRADGSPVAGGAEDRRGWLVGDYGDWQRRLDDVTRVVGLAPLDGGFALAGTRDASPTALGLARLAAFGSDGRELWSHDLPGQGRGEPAGVAVRPDGTVVAVGHRDEPGRLWIVCAGAELVWERLLEGGDQRGAAIAVLPDGDVAVAGDARKDGRRSVIVARLASDGAPRWQQTLLAGEEDVARGLAATPDGGLVVVGSTLPGGGGGTQACVRRLDGDGELAWVRSFAANPPG